MPWDDESWKDSYDAWKLASPYDDCEEDECQHDYYEADILIGRATCNRCGHWWWQTREEIDAEIERIRAYDEWERAQRTLRYRITEWFLGLLFRLRCRWAIRHRKELVDDEIPF